mgnify:FL=1
MKICLAFAKIQQLKQMEIISNEHIGLGYIANSLSQKNYDYKIIDGHFFDYSIEEMAKRILDEKFDVIGFSVVYSNFRDTIEIIDLIKKMNPNIFVFLGGQHVSFCAKEILINNKNVDLIMCGEGEFTTIELMEYLEGKKELEEIQGITYRSNDARMIRENAWRQPRTRIEDYGEIKRDVLDEGLQKGLTCSLNIMAGRGCIFNCSFCTGNRIFNPYKNCSWRVSIAENIVKNLKDLIRKYNKYDNLYEIVNFCDLNFINETKDGLKWIDDFTNLMKQENLDIWFYVMTRVDSIVNQQKRMKQLRDCGLVQVEMGLESGNDQGLAVYNKHISTSQSIKAVNLLRKLRIDFGMSGFIMYHPYITLDELRKNSEFLMKIEYWKVLFLYTKMALYPGAEITEQVKKTNLLYDTYSHYEVYDYRFQDERIEVLYNSIVEKIPFEILNEYSESISYIELQMTLNYRKLERISTLTETDFNKRIHSIELPLNQNIYLSKELIHKFFLESISLAEEGWNEKKFETLAGVFSLKYTKINDKIIKLFNEYGNNILEFLEVGD